MAARLQLILVSVVGAKEKMKVRLSLVVILMALMESEQSMTDLKSKKVLAEGDI